MTAAAAPRTPDRRSARWFVHLLVYALGSSVAGAGVLIDAKPAALIAIGCGLLGLAGGLVI